MRQPAGLLHTEPEEERRQNGVAGGEIGPDDSGRGFAGPRPMPWTLETERVESMHSSGEYHDWRATSTNGAEVGAAVGGRLLFPIVVRIIQENTQALAQIVPDWDTKTE